MREQRATWAPITEQPAEQDMVTVLLATADDDGVVPEGKEYRIILKTIHMTYHYQAKSDVSVTFKISREQIENGMLGPLKTQEAVFREFPVEVYDAENNHICTGLINWQIKAWKNVKMKV